MTEPTPPPDRQPPGPGRGDGVMARFVAEIVSGQTLLVTFLSLFTALVAGAVLIVLSEDATREPLGYLFSRPGDFFSAVGTTVGDAYGALFSGSLGGPRPWSETLVAATPLMLTGLAFALPFRALLINIGGEGQFVAGALAGSLVGFGITGLPLVVHLPLVLLAGAVGGAVYGWIPGILKARTGAHEVIVTIMLNNIGLLLLGWMLTTEFVRTPGRSDPISRALLSSAQLPGLPGFRLHSGLFVALAAAVVSWWLIERSTYGFEVKAVGHNARAAQFAGMRPARVHWSILLIGGAMAGLGGIVLISGVAPHRLTGGFSAGLGFDGITVALLGRSSPAGIVAAAILFGALEAGGLRMQVATQTSLDLVTVVQAMVVLFIAAPPLIRSLYRVRAERPAELEASTGWSA